MKLAAYAFLTDENINPIIVQSLRQRSCDVFDVKEQQLSGDLCLTFFLKKKSPPSVKDRLLLF